MQMRIEIRLLAIALTSTFLLAAPAQGQQPITKNNLPPSLELTYDYVHTNGPPNNCGCINLNGAGLAYVYPLPKSSFALVGRLGGSHAGSIGTLGYDLTLFTYTFGARYLPKLKYRIFQPYGELQIGGVHASGTLAGAPSLAGNGIGSAFAASGGGGINIATHHRVSFKLIDAEYLVNTYANGSSDHQNDLRISTGFIFSLCKPGNCPAGK